MDIQNYSFGISPTMMENRAVFQSSMHKGIWLQCTKKMLWRRNTLTSCEKQTELMALFMSLQRSGGSTLLLLTSASDGCSLRERKYLSQWPLLTELCPICLIWSSFIVDMTKAALINSGMFFFFSTSNKRGTQEYKHITRTKVHYTKQDQLLMVMKWGWGGGGEGQIKDKTSWVQNIDCSQINADLRQMKAPIKPEWGTCWGVIGISVHGQVTESSWNKIRSCASSRVTLRRSMWRLSVSLLELYTNSTSGSTSWVQSHSVEQ